MHLPPTVSTPNQRAAEKSSPMVSLLRTAQAAVTSSAIQDRVENVDMFISVRLV